MIPIFPKNLSKGSRIAVVSPAGSVEYDDVLQTKKLIESEGYEVVFGSHCFGKYEMGYSYSGTVQERVSDLNWAFQDSEIDAVWASRGGYGCQQLLSYLDFSVFKKNPKWYIGYSDNTVIQSFLLKEGIASIHGQTLKTSSFGIDENSFSKIFQILKGEKYHYTIEKYSFNKVGKSEGILVGGNLALIYALLGTPYRYDFQDKILFIEEIGEHFYALDRMLTSLELAGVFSQIKGLIIGGMIMMGDEKNPNYNHSFDDLAYEIIFQKIQPYDFPVLFTFPNGHIYSNYPLIIGGKVELSVSENFSELKLI